MRRRPGQGRCPRLCGRAARPRRVLIIDDTGFIKKGTTSAGVGRQYTGTSGKIDNCQIGVFAAYATSSGRALVDRELYLPKAWTSERKRCRAAKIRDERGFATKGELARCIVRRCLVGLGQAWSGVGISRWQVGQAPVQGARSVCSSRTTW